jgi:hypothetical protein
MLLGRLLPLRWLRVIRCSIGKLFDDGVFLLQSLCHFSYIFLQPSNPLLSHVILLRIVIGQVLNHVILSFYYFTQKETCFVESFIQHILTLLQLGKLCLEVIGVILGLEKVLL